MKIEDSPFLSLYVHLSLLLVWFFFPILSIIPICAFLYHTKLFKAEIYFYFLLLALVPGMVNYTKLPELDLAQYVDEYYRLYHLKITEVSSVSPVDPFFYYTSFLLAHMSGGNAQLLPFFWTTLTYFCFFCALYEFNEVFRDGSKKRMVGTVFFALMIGLDFSLSAHLIRQYAALSILMIAIARYCNNKKYILFLVLAFCTHFSTAIFLPIFLMMKLPSKTLTISLWILFLLALKVGSVNILEYLDLLPGFSNAALVNIAEKATVYVEKDDGGLNLRLYVEIAFYLIIVVYMLMKGKDKYSKETGNAIRKFGLIFIGFIIVLLLVRNNNLLMFRYFFYLAFLTTMVLLILFRQHNLMTFAVFVFFMISSPVRLIRILPNNTFTYIDNSYNIMFYNVAEFLSYKVSN